MGLGRWLRSSRWDLVAGPRGVVWEYTGGAGEFSEVKANHISNRERSIRR